jgi:hypothetical protein
LWILGSQKLFRRSLKNRPRGSSDHESMHRASLMIKNRNVVSLSLIGSRMLKNKLGSSVEI